MGQKSWTGLILRRLWIMLIFWSSARRLDQCRLSLLRAPLRFWFPKFNHQVRTKWTTSTKTMTGRNPNCPWWNLKSQNSWKCGPKKKSITRTTTPTRRRTQNRKWSTSLTTCKLLSSLKWIPLTPCLPFQNTTKESISRIWPHQPPSRTYLFSQNQGSSQDISQNQDPRYRKDWELTITLKSRKKSSLKLQV